MYVDVDSCYDTIAPSVAASLQAPTLFTIAKGRRQCRLGDGLVGRGKLAL